LSFTHAARLFLCPSASAAAYPASATFRLSTPHLLSLCSRRLSGTRCAGFALATPGQTTSIGPYGLGVSSAPQQFLMMTTCAVVILLYQTGEFVLAMDQAEGERRRRLPAG
jgi:hypothetical protein